MATKSSPALLSASQSFVAEIEGTSYDVRAGDVVEADHPLAQKYAVLFQPVPLRFPMERRVEQATAAPGEKRGA